MLRIAAKRLFYFKFTAFIHKQQIFAQVGIVLPGIQQLLRFKMQINTKLSCSFARIFFNLSTPLLLLHTLKFGMRIQDLPSADQ